MIRKKSEGPLPPPNLRVSKQEALKEIKSLIEKGRSILEKEINSKEDFEETDSSESNWSSYCHDILTRCFDNQTYYDEFNLAGLRAAPPERLGGPPSLNHKIAKMKKRIKAQIIKLESISERIEIIPDPTIEVPNQGITHETLTKGRDIFLVHGHDEAAKQAVARYLEKLNLNTIILHEKADKGRTIIEKFEDYSDVGFAIILLTPDDMGYKNGEPGEVKPRARQNVIFELGYFIGKLGRGNVCALYKEGFELPSDIRGVLYVPMDSADGWHVKLAREIKHAGIEVDLNKVI
jgi:predicted nucleotide-binding protein